MAVEDQAAQKGKGSGGRARALGGSHQAQEGRARRPGVQGAGLSRGCPKEAWARPLVGKLSQRQASGPGLDACEPS